jgi:HAD superfamily hydrolase (TIGR01549 family)
LVGSSGSAATSISAQIEIAIAVLNKIKGLLFDIDDTLFNRRLVFQDWLDHFARDIMGFNSVSALAHIKDEAGRINGSGYGSKKELIEIPPPLKSEYDDVIAYEEFVRLTRLGDDAGELLTELDRRSIPYGIVSNGGSRQVDKIQRLGLYVRVKCVFVSSVFGQEKPDQSIFIAAARCIEVAPTNILFVGDHPVNDIAGANSCGMMTAWLHNDQPWADELLGIKPTLVIDTLNDLIPLIDQLNDSHWAAVSL